MLDESKRFRDEEEYTHPEPLPDELAKKFVDGTFLNDAHVIKEKPKNISYQLYEREELVPGLDQTKLSVSYRKYHHPTSESPDLIRFDYTRSDAGEHQSVAEMHLGIMNPQLFGLVHRYVDPALRIRSGIGSRLLETAEGWVRQVAKESHHPITIRLQTGQESVIRWIQKMGYTVKEGHREILEEIQEHPERFFEDEVILSEESRGNKIVKDPYLFRAGTEGRYMEDAVRLTFEKQIADKESGT